LTKVNQEGLADLADLEAVEEAEMVVDIEVAEAEAEEDLEEAVVAAEMADTEEEMTIIK